MAVKPVAVVVLVCPQCGKKYKGDASKPDARYQCPVDQSTLIRLDTDAAAAARQARTSPAAGENPSVPGPGSENGIAPAANLAGQNGEAAAPAAPGFSAAYGSDGDDSQEI